MIERGQHEARGIRGATLGSCVSLERHRARPLEQKLDRFISTLLSLLSV